MNKSPKKKRVKCENSPHKARSWKQNCRELIDHIFRMDDSSPFRSPVDPIQYPDYSQVIDTPMDLTTVKEQLLEDLYENPHEFCKDMRLIFQNSKTFNTNKKSRIYGMTIRLSSFFEEKMRRIVSDWKSNVNYQQRLKKNMYTTRKPLPLSPICSNKRSPVKKNMATKSRRAISSSLSPSYDLSQPSTSGYSSRNKSNSSQNSNKKIKNTSPKSSPRKNNNRVAKRNKTNVRNQDKSNIGFRGRMFKKQGAVEPSVENKRKIARRTRKRVVKSESDEEQTEKEAENFNINEDTMNDTLNETIIDEEIKHFESDTEIEDEAEDEDEHDVAIKVEMDSDATEIDDATEEEAIEDNMSRLNDINNKSPFTSLLVAALVTRECQFS